MAGITKHRLQLAMQTIDFKKQCKRSISRNHTNNRFQETMQTIDFKKPYKQPISRNNANDRFQETIQTTDFKKPYKQPIATSNTNHHTIHMLQQTTKLNIHRLHSLLNLQRRQTLVDGKRCSVDDFSHNVETAGVSDTNDDPLPLERCVHGEKHLHVGFGVSHHAVARLLRTHPHQLDRVLKALVGMDGLEPRRQLRGARLHHRGGNVRHARRGGSRPREELGDVHDGEVVLL